MANVIGAVLLLSALALAPFIGGGFGELTNGVAQILVFCGIGCRLLLSRRDSGMWARVPGMWLLAAFLALTVISIFTSRAIYFSLTQFLFIAACLGAYMLSATICRDKKVAAAAVWLLVVTAMAVSVLGIRRYALDAGGGMSFWKAILSPGDHDRLFGPFINPSFFAGYLVIALPITLGVYLVARRAALVTLAGIGFVVDVLALMLTGAKFGIIAAVAALGIFFLLAIFTKSLRRARFMRLLLICVVVTPLLILFSAPVRSRIQAAESGGSQVHSTLFRVYTWKATLDMIEDQPWLGVGPGGYAINYREYTIAGYAANAHNSYLQLAAENGVPALIAFLLLLMAIYRGALLGIAGRMTRPSGHPREVSDEPVSDAITWMDMVPFSGWRLMNCALFAALVGSAIRSLVDSDWYVMGISLPFWIMAGVLVSQSGAAEKDITPSKVARFTLAGLCAILVIASASFGLGDLFSARAESLIESKPEDVTGIIDLYQHAVVVSPLNPEYHRQLAIWIGSSDFATADQEIGTSIGLARNTSEGGWYARAMLAGMKRDWPETISSLRTALKFSPKSTQLLYKLAQAYQVSGDMREYESTLKRLIAIEDSPYEQIKGTPEIVDTTYSFAHAYFGDKHLRQRKFALAISEYLAAIDRLERWRSSGNMRKIQRMMGQVSEEDEQSLLDLLRNCYRNLALAYMGMGNKTAAEEVIGKAAKVK